MVIGGTNAGMIISLSGGSSQPAGEEAAESNDEGGEGEGALCSAFSVLPHLSSVVLARLVCLSK